MGALLFSNFWVTDMKLRNENDMDSIILLHFFVFSLLCCKYLCDIYLSMLDFNGLWKFNNIFIYKITEDIQ